MNDALLGIAIISFPFGFAIGANIAYKLNPPTDKQLFDVMDGIVNQEELEEKQRLLKFQMARNGRKTLRFDSGPNARITKMRVRVASRRFRKE